MAFSIAIIGAGPRGTYCLRRVSLYLENHPFHDPVTIHVIEKSGKFGGIRTFVNTDGKDSLELGGLDVTDDFQLIGSSGEVHPQICAIGIPLEGKYWFNAADARPDVNSNAIKQLDRWIESMASRLRKKDTRPAS